MWPRLFRIAQLSLFLFPSSLAICQTPNTVDKDPIVVIGSDGHLHVGTQAGEVVAGNDPRLVNALKNLGTYSGTVTYTVNDMVTYGGVMFVSQVPANVGNQPDVSLAQWKPFAGGAGVVTKAAVDALGIHAAIADQATQAVTATTATTAISAGSAARATLADKATALATAVAACPAGQALNQFSADGTSRTCIASSASTPATPAVAGVVFTPSGTTGNQLAAVAVTGHLEDLTVAHPELNGGFEPRTSNTGTDSFGACPTTGAQYTTANGLPAWRDPGAGCTVHTTFPSSGTPTLPGTNQAVTATSGVAQASPLSIDQATGNIATPGSGNFHGVTSIQFDPAATLQANYNSTITTTFTLTPDQIIAASGGVFGSLQNSGEATNFMGPGFDTSENGYVRNGVGKGEYGVHTFIMNAYNKGQHSSEVTYINCYSEGDCIHKSAYIQTNGGCEENANECTHIGDIQIYEDPDVPRGTLFANYAPGSGTAVSIVNAQGAQLAGAGRYMGDKTKEVTPAAKIASWDTDATRGLGWSQEHFTAAVMTPDTFLMTATGAVSGATTLAPGPTPITLTTAGLPSGFLATAASLPASGVACAVDVQRGSNAVYYEQVPFTKTDATHLTMNYHRVHVAPTVIFYGPNCGMGFHPTADDIVPLGHPVAKQLVVPIYGCIDASTCWVDRKFEIGNASGNSSVRNLSYGIASMARDTNGLVTLVAGGLAPENIAGRQVTIAGSLSDLSGVTPALNLVSNVEGQATFTYQTATTGAPETAGAGGGITFNNGTFGVLPIMEITDATDHAATPIAVNGNYTIAPAARNFSAGDLMMVFPNPWMGVGGADQKLESTYIPQLNAPIHGPCGLNLGAFTNSIASTFTIACENTNSMPASMIEGYGGTHRAPGGSFASVGAFQNPQYADVMHGAWGQVWNQYDSRDRYFYPQVFTTSVAQYKTRFDWGTRVYDFGPDINVHVHNLSVDACTGAGCSTGGATFPATTALLKGTGTVNGIAAATPGTDYLTPAATGTTVAAQNDPRIVNAAQVGLPASPDAIYRFTETSGTTLADTSGNGRNISLPAVPPTLTGQGVQFTSTSTYPATATGGEQLTTPLSGRYQSAGVCFTYTPGEQDPPQGISADFVQVPTFLSNATFGGSLTLSGYDIVNGDRTAMGTIIPAVLTPSGSSVTTLDGVTGGPHCILHVRGASVDRLYLDGKVLSTLTNTGSSGATAPTSAITIGGPTDSNAANFAWLGTFHSTVLWMGTQLTPAQASQYFAWANADLATKGVTGAVAHPNDHVSRAIFFGDSITGCAGVGGPTAASCFWRNLTLDDSELAANVQASAMPGGTAQFTAIAAPYRAGALFDPLATKNVASILNGTNDTCRNQYSPLETWTREVQWSKYMHSIGVKTIVGTMLSLSNANNCSTNNESGDAAKNEFNNIIRKRWAESFDGIADYASVPGLGGDGQSAGSYFSDGVHPSASGNSLMALIASRAINRLTGASVASPTTITAATYPMTNGDNYLTVPNTVTNAVALTLPPCFGPTGATYSITNALQSSSNPVTAIGSASNETINGSTSAAIIPPNSIALFTPVIPSSSNPSCIWRVSGLSSSTAAPATVAATQVPYGSPSNTLTSDGNYTRTQSTSGSQTTGIRVGSPANGGGVNLQNVAGIIGEFTANAIYDGTNWIAEAAFPVNSLSLNSTGSNFQGWGLASCPTQVAGAIVVGLDTACLDMIGTPGGKTYFNPGTPAPTDRNATSTFFTGIPGQKGTVVVASANQTANLAEWQNLDGSLAASVGPQGQVQTSQIVPSGAPAGAAVGPGAGTSPTFLLGIGAGVVGAVSVGVGTAPSANAVVLTMNYGPYALAPNACFLEPMNAATVNAPVWTSAPTTTGFTINTGSVSLNASTTYKWGFHCI